MLKEYGLDTQYLKVEKEAMPRKNIPFQVSFAAGSLLNTIGELADPTATICP